jgi:hypothetical protein
VVESMLEFEVVESLLALSRNLLAVVERLLAPSFLRVAKICASRRAQIANEKVQYTRMKPPTAGSVGSRGHGVVLRVRWWVGLVVRFVCVIRVCRVCSGSPPGFFDGLVIGCVLLIPKVYATPATLPVRGSLVFCGVPALDLRGIVTRWSAACRRWFLVALLS